MTVGGAGPWIRRQTSDGGGGLQGVTIRLSSETGFNDDSPSSTIIQFDQIWPDTATDWVNTSALDSSDFGAASVQPGWAIQIPDSMPASAWYEVSGQARLVLSGDGGSNGDGQYGVQLGILRGDSEGLPAGLFTQNVLNTVPSTGLAGFVVLDISFARQVYPAPLSPGDYLFMEIEVVGDIGSSANSTGSRATLTLTYFQTVDTSGS